MNLTEGEVKGHRDLAVAMAKAMLAVWKAAPKTVRTPPAVVERVGGSVQDADASMQITVMLNACAYALPRTPDVCAYADMLLSFAECLETRILGKHSDGVALMLHAVDHISPEKTATVMQCGDNVVH